MEAQQQQPPPPPPPVQPHGDGFTSHIAGMSRSQLYDIMCQMKVLIDQNQQQARQILVDNPLLTRALFQTGSLVSKMGSSALEVGLPASDLLASARLSHHHWEQNSLVLEIGSPALDLVVGVINGLADVEDALIGIRSARFRRIVEAQIMLGMVRPPQVIPNIQKTLPQPQSVQMGLQTDVQNTQSLPDEAGLQGQASSSQTSVPPGQPHPKQTGVSVSPLTFQSQPIPSNVQQSTRQTKEFLNAQISSAVTSQSSQIHSVPLPPPVPPQYSVLHPHLPNSSQIQQSLQTPGHLQQPLAPPLPQQPRPPFMQPFSHQLHYHMPHSLGFQPSSAPQPLLSQPVFHGSNPLSSYSQGPPPLPSQPPVHQPYQGGPHLGPDYANQAGSSMQAERPPWAPVLPEKATVGTQFPGPPPSVPGQMGPGPGGQLSRPPLLTPEMESALLQQVMSLTPEQINLLPPEQRQQVIQLQEMLR